MERKDIRPEWTRKDGFGGTNRSDSEQSSVPGKPDNSDNKPAKPKAEEDDGA